MLRAVDLLRPTFVLPSLLSLAVLTGCPGPGPGPGPDTNHPTINLFGFEESELHHIHNTVELHRNYFGKGGANPWGGVEAVLTHTTSTVLNCPTAHAPTMSSEAIRSERWGVVEPRKAAEVISSTYLFCVLKGLNRAPQVVTKVNGIYDPSMMQAEDISALVIPDGSRSQHSCM